MREYETIYIMKPDLSQETIKIIQDKVEALIKKAEGHILCHVSWGKRKFAYCIEKLKYGQYFYFQYLSNGQELVDLDKIFKYDDNVLRAVTVKLQDVVDVEKRKAEPVEAPSAPVEDYSDSSYERKSFRDKSRGHQDFALEKNDVSGDDEIDIENEEA
ncbi:MAG: 30S ribosomal protein S6 [Deltaproteobacteria bacterium]|nr:30S ribosomal protein S6 [Deltaproteobacteria bacterium]